MTTAPTGNVSSGVAGVRIAQVTEAVLDPAQHLAAVRDPYGGADVLFCGVVRDHDHGRAVVELEYSAHPTAADVVRDVAEDIARHPDVVAVAVSHRIGVLGVHDVALVAAVSCAHRAEAFLHCARLVDEVKARLPVWKRQVFQDGTDEWVNCP